MLKQLFTIFTLFISASSIASPNPLAQQIADRLATYVPYNLDNVTAITKISASDNTIHYQYKTSLLLSITQIKHIIKKATSTNCSFAFDSLLSKDINIAHTYLSSKNNSLITKFTVTKRSCQ